MTPFTTLTSLAIPLLRDNVDTDAIIPSREMRSTGRTGLADGLFAPWRYSDVDARTPDLDFALNRPEYAHAQIVAAGANFGCGSSREHAVWALAEWGIRAVIAPGFAPIFRSNCVRNGVLPVVGDAAAVAGREVTIDLAAQTVTWAGGKFDFAIGAEDKAMLLEGLDGIDLTLKQRDAIAAWTAQDRQARPWVYLTFPPHPKDGEGDHPKGGGGVKKLPPKTNAAIVRAKALRRSLTPPEARLWSMLKQRPAGLKFRKQHPAPPHTLDFYCAAAALCIELDGISHDMADNPLRDARRDAYLEEHGIKTLRFPALSIRTELEVVVEQIVAEARLRIPLHHPAGGPPPQSEIGEDR